MAIHILGNGPSIRLFDRDAWPETDLFVGCNFSDPRLRPHFVSLIDVRAMKSLLKGHIPEAPVLLSGRAADYGDKQNPEWRDLLHYPVEAVMDLIRYPSVSKDLAMNSGQHGLVYALNAYQEHTDSVHLWGIDSFWTDNMASTTDSITRADLRGDRVRPQITRCWRRYWDVLFSGNQDTTFHIHTMNGMVVSSSHMNQNNVQVVYHDDDGAKRPERI